VGLPGIGVLAARACLATAELLHEVVEQVPHSARVYPC
jgi:hypothetical protein